MSPAKSQENEKGGCETVLLVEDEESVRELVRETLEARGYKVLEAENGESGLRVAEAHGEGIDILITDVVMPGMGGRELAKRLLQTPPAPRGALSLRLHRGHDPAPGRSRPRHRIPAKALHPAKSRPQSARSPARDKLRPEPASIPTVQLYVLLSVLSPMTWDTTGTSAPRCFAYF